MFMKKLIVPMLIIYLFISMVGCGGAPTVPPINSESELVLVQVTDPESNIIFVIGEENKDAIAILGEKDNEGDPTSIKGAVYVLEQGDLFGIEAGKDGFPAYTIDSEGNTVIFENYTNSTVDVSIYNSNGIPIQGTATIDVDPADLAELKQLYNSFYSKGLRWSRKNTADVLKWGGLGISWTSCVISTAVSTATVAATVGVSIAACANAMTSTIAAITPDDTDNMISITTGISSCALNPSLTCGFTTILSIIESGIEQSTPISPTPLSPGSSSAPGPIIYTLTPTLTWAEVDNADYYDLAIKEYPYNTNIIYNFQEIYGSSFVVPSERLEVWKKYCWNVRAHNGNGFGNYSETLYFQIENVNELLTITTIIASAGPHGSISPSGDQIVNLGSDQSFAITPDTGYQIDDVLVDGSSVGAVSSYTFINVTENHTISATFKSSDIISASINSYSPSSKITVNTGQSFTINTSFTNTGNTAAYFYPGVSIWNSNGSLVFTDWGGKTYLNKDQQGSASWNHTINTPGEYWLQFGIWNEAKSELLDKKPSPSQNLIKVDSVTQLAPQVTGVDPSQPTVNPLRQYIDILGNNFANNAQVTLQINSSVYPIPDDRTQFINSARIEIYVGLTDFGNWKVWITNPDGQKSNEYIFYVKP